MKFLTTDEMAVVRETFKDSVSHLLSNYAPESTPAIISFVYNMALTRKPYTTVTQAGVAELVDFIFTNERERDFVLTLVFMFFARWGQSDEQLQGLAGSLARGVSFNEKAGGKLNVIPSELQDRLTTTDEVWELLYENRWLMVILLMQLYITLADTKP